MLLLVVLKMISKYVDAVRTSYMLILPISPENKNNIS
jgi:hypothetical protein